MKILNIAAGKFSPLGFEDDNIMLPKYTLNIDTSYYTSIEPGIIEREIIMWEMQSNKPTMTNNLNEDIFEFMNCTSLIFDRVVIYRFLEHVEFTQVDYFIYLVSTILKKGGLVDVIVPNYRILAQMILDEENGNVADFEPWNILLTTELLNEPSCPHASIWTPDRIEKFWEKEGRFKVIYTEPVFKFDGRDIYLRSKIERI